MVVPAVVVVVIAVGVENAVSIAVLVVPIRGGAHPFKQSDYYSSGPPPPPPNKENNSIIC